MRLFAMAFGLCAWASRCTSDVGWAFLRAAVRVHIWLDEERAEEVGGLLLAAQLHAVRREAENCVQ